MRQPRSVRPAPQGPLSRFMSLDELAALPGGRMTIEASSEERIALAKANDIQQVKDLRADVHVLIQPREVVISGEVRAHIVQICVVTLDPFESDLREPIDIRFAPQPAGPTSGRRAREPEKLASPDHDALGDDPPEPLIGEYIDVGAVVAEFFALGLDPYPRKPGAAFETKTPDGSPAEQTAPPSENPFAALAKLRKPDPGGTA